MTAFSGGGVCAIVIDDTDNAQHIAAKRMIGSPTGSDLMPRLLTPLKPRCRELRVDHCH